MTLNILAPFLETEKTRTLFRGGAATLLLRAVSMLIRMLTGILMARMLGASHYGVYAYAITWSALLSVSATAGLEQIVLRFVSTYKESQEWPALRGLLRFSIQLGLTVALLLSAAGVLSIYVFSADALFRQTMIIALMSLPIIVLNKVEQSALRGLDHSVLAQGPENIVYPCAMVILTALAYAFLNGNVTAVHAAVASIAGWALALGLSSVFLVRTLPPRLRLAAPEYRRNDWLTMVPSLIVASVAYHGVSRGEVLVLGLLRPSAEVGIYTIASRGAELMLFMYDAVSIVGASLFASLYAKGDMEELQRFTTLVTRSILFASLPVLMVFLAVAPWFLSLFGHEFSQGATVMRILSTTFFLSSLSGFIVVMLYMTGHQTAVAVTMGIMALGNIVLAAALIPFWGMAGAAVASGTTLVLLHGSLVVVLYRRVGIISLPFAPRQLANLSRR